MLSPAFGRARAWAAANRIKAAILGVACVGLLGGLTVVGLLARQAQDSADGTATLEEALEALDEGAYAEARSLAEVLRDQGQLPFEQLGGPVFVLGAVACYEADDTWSKEKTNSYLVAARYLEDARDRGFPPGRRAQGLFLLGKSLYLSGQIPASRAVLRTAMKVDQDKKTVSEIHRLLALACLNDAKPKLEQALSHNSEYLRDRTLAASQRHEALLEQSKILLRMEKIPECLAALGKIPPDAKNRAEALIVRSRVMIHEAQALKNDPTQSSDDHLKARRGYQNAITTLRRAQGQDTISNEATRKAMYLIGICFQELGKYAEARDQFSRTRKRFADTAEALAADFQEAELSRQLGRNADALSAYRRVLGAVTDTSNYSNPWITLDELRQRMLKAYKQYLDTRNFEISFQLAQEFYPLFSRVRVMQLTGETQSLWGHSLLAQADHLVSGSPEPLRRQGRAQLRSAGRVYEKLAKLRIATRHYPDDLWASATNYMEGQGYQRAARVLREYLKNESRRRHPRALANLGETMLALNEIDQALEAFQECIEFHTHDAAAFRARLMAAKAHMEKGDLKQAESMVERNLSGDFLTPSSNEWRDSLFYLGYLLHVDGRYDGPKGAICRLEEAVERYPDAPQTMLARYMIADSHHRSAQSTIEKVEKEATAGAHLAQVKQIHNSLQAALENYSQVQEELRRRQERTQLTSLESLTLRNCYFSIGDVLFKLKRYEEAVRAYTTATNRYQEKPEVLEAYVQIARAYEHLNEPVKARGTLEQAKVVLSRIRTEVPFDKTSNYNRQEWRELLDWLSSL